MIQIAIIAPTPAVRAGLRLMVSPPAAGETGGLQICFESASLAEFGQEMPPADILIILEGSLSLAELGPIAEAYDGRLAALLLTDSIEAAGEMGIPPFRAWGVLSLDSSEEELQAALHALQEGLLVGTPALLTTAVANKIPGELPGIVETLTDRELEVLQRLAHGLANKQIALALGVSEHTVKFHISSIYRKLGVTNRTEAVRSGFHRGLVSL